MVVNKMIEYNIPQVLLSEEPPKRNLFILDDTGLPIQFNLLDLYSEGNTPAFEYETENKLDIWTKLEIIQNAGGELIRGDMVEYDIPLAVRKKDEKLDGPILKRIREYSIVMKRDVFDINFIYDSLSNGNLVNLERYRITSSIFEEYDLNDILYRKKPWSSLTLKKEVSDSNCLNIFQSSNPLSSAFINDLNMIFNDDTGSSFWTDEQKKETPRPSTTSKEFKQKNLEKENVQVFPNQIAMTLKRKRNSQVSETSQNASTTKRPMFSSTPKFHDSEEILHQLLATSSDTVGISPIVPINSNRSIDSPDIQSFPTDPKYSKTAEFDIQNWSSKTDAKKTTESSPDILFPTPPTRSQIENQKSKLTSLIKSIPKKDANDEPKKITPVEFTLSSDEEAEVEIVYQGKSQQPKKANPFESDSDSDTDFDEEENEENEKQKEGESELPFFTAPENFESQ